MKPLSVTKSPKGIVITGISLLGLLFATTSPAPQELLVTTNVNNAVYGITSATPDLQTQSLTINGNFPTNMGNPTVKLADTTQTVANFTAASIPATLPNLPPATYVLSVSFGSGNGGKIFGINVTIPPATSGGGGGGDGGVPHYMREFTASGTWVVPSGVTRLLVEVWGAGGSGGYTIGCDPFPIPGPGGTGGAGAYSRSVISVAEGDTLTITVGHGGSGGQAGGFSSVNDGPTVLIQSGGGGPGGEGACNQGDDGSPGTPDPNAQIGRSCAFQRRGSAGGFVNTDPAPGTIQPLGGFGGSGAGLVGDPPSSGADGYVFIQW